MGQLQKPPATLGDQTEFRKILVGFDGSKCSEKALRVACSLAGKLLSKLVVVSVYSSPAYGPGPDGMLVASDDIKKEFESRAEELVKQAVGFARTEAVDASGEALDDQSAAVALARYAVTNDVDLIVLGTRNLTGPRKLVSRSVSKAVVTKAHCPVLVVK